MPYILVRHKVEDFDRWKAAFDGQAPARGEAGSKGGYVFRNADDPNEVVALLEWDERERVEQFILSEDMQQTMLNSGVTELPSIYYLDVADRPAV